MVIFTENRFLKPIGLLPISGRSVHTLPCTPPVHYPNTLVDAVASHLSNKPIFVNLRCVQRFWSASQRRHVAFKTASTVHKFTAIYHPPPQMNPRDLWSHKLDTTDVYTVPSRACHWFTRRARFNIFMASPLTRPPIKRLVIATLSEQASFNGRNTMIFGRRRW